MNNVKRYLVRGKRIDNGEYVEGLLVNAVTRMGDDTIIQADIRNPYDTYRVDPDTVEPVAMRMPEYDYDCPNCGEYIEPNVYFLVTSDLDDAEARLEVLRTLGAITVYAQAERNERLGLRLSKQQLEFAQRYVYGGSWRRETWQQYEERLGQKL